MAKEQTKFRYVHQIEECCQTEHLETCVVCGLLRPGYSFLWCPEDDTNDDDFVQHQVCEPCLVAGRLAELNLKINHANSDALWQQLEAIRPEMSIADRQSLADERTNEIEWRTPYPDVHQMFLWPAHCGDYCIFHQQVDADDLNRLAPDGDGKAFLVSHAPSEALYEGEPDNEYIDSVWEDRLQGFINFYLWRCTQCATYLLTTDFE